MNKLCLSIPPFVRIDRVMITCVFAQQSSRVKNLFKFCLPLFFLSYLNYGVITGNRTVHWTLHVSSSHDRRAPLPFIDSVEVKLLPMVTDKLVLVSLSCLCFQVLFPDRPDLKSAVIKEQPFILRRWFCVHIMDKTIQRFHALDGKDTYY